MSWDKVEAVLPYAKGIAFDGCHKIYLALDDEEVSNFKMYGYGTDEGSWFIPVTTDKFDQDLALKQLHDWFDNSCDLRFIEAVRNAGFNSLIAQCEIEED